MQFDPRFMDRGLSLGGSQFFHLPWRGQIDLGSPAARSFQPAPDGLSIHGRGLNTLSRTSAPFLPEVFLASM